MTEQEFLRQVWRAYDSVELDNGLKRRVLNVCFPTRSVQVALDKTSKEWFRCELIVSHTSVTGEPDDLAIIADLHHKLMKAEDKIENMQKVIDEQKKKLAVDPSEGLKNLRKFVTEVRDSLSTKQKRLTRAISSMDNIDRWLDDNGVPKASEIPDAKVQFGPSKRTPIEAEDIDISKLRIDEGEKERIKRALEESDWNKKEAAARLGVSERTLYRKIKEYQLKSE